MLDYRAVDAAFFAEHLEAHLPEEVFDCHTHLGLPDQFDPISEARKRESWALEVGQTLDARDLGPMGERLFPRRRARWVAFGMPIRETHLDQANDYAAASRRAGRVDVVFLVTDPAWSGAEVRERVRAGGFAGLKPYPDLARGLAPEQVGIPEYLPDAHLEVAAGEGLAVMLHLPRAERLRDPRNIAELRAVATAYPTVPIIVAHIGRAYTVSFAAGQVEQLADLPNVHFDFAANLNADVMELTLRAVGPQRLLYGSDLPITLMHGRRGHVGDRYINYTDGDYSWNTDLEPPEVQATYTLFLYEQLRAFLVAAERVGLSREDVADVMGGNARRLVRL